MTSAPLKVFVSSTYEDLKTHRAHVISVLRKAGIFVDPMEDWTAESDEPRKFSQDRLAGCNFCVLLVALRRGFIPNGETRSITQLEYQAALDQGIDVLVYLLDENSPWPHRFVDLDRDPELSTWRRSLEERHGRQLFGLDPTSIDIAPAVTRWVDKQSRKASKVGDDWIQLVSNLLDLPKNQPETWAIAANLLPYALDAVQRAYSGGLSPKSAVNAGTALPSEMSQPIRTLVAGARQYVEDSRAVFDRTCLVITPFGRKSFDGRIFDFDSIYHKIFEPAINGVSLPGAEKGMLIPRRLDHTSLDGDISHKTYDYLEYSRVVLADITGLNANVFYELGHRHRARASGTVIVVQRDTPVPFDISETKVIRYLCEPLEEVEKSRQLIQQVLEVTLRDERVDSPVFRALGSTRG